MDSLYNDTLNISRSIFGPESIVLAPNLTINIETPGIFDDSILLKVLTIVILALYAFCIHYFKGYLEICVLALFKPKTLEKYMGERSYIFDAFIKLLVITGILTLSLTTLTILELLTPSVTSGIISASSTNIKVVTILAINVVLYIYKIIIISIVGKLTYHDSLSKYLIRYLNLRLITSALIIAPIYLLLFQSFGIWQTILLYMIAAILILMLFFLYFNSYRVFIQQKVSVLYWFLYLCTVEFLPISFALILVGKNLP